MKRFFPLQFAILLFALLNTASLNAQRKCGSYDHLQDMMQSDPDFAASRQAIEQQTTAFLANPANLNNNRAVITIPVVVHVVYNTTAQNVSQAQIQSQIDRLNLDYRKLNTDWTNTPSVWQSLVTDYQIEFCLASRDPNGNSTTGIIRKQTSTTSFSTNDNVKRAANGGDDAWPAASYLNLWVCNLSGGVLGYAQFPGGAAATDGVVINYTAFGSTGTAAAPYNLGRTATHEIGHWLNLYHIWGDDGTACTGSDNVNDTPNQADENYGCPTYPSVSCSNGPNGDMFMNYMDYTDDACMYMFTAGQYARSSALFASGGSRYSLTQSLGCQAVSPLPVANFSATPTSSCTGIIQFTDLSTGSPTTWLWNFGDGSTSTQQNPSHLYGQNGTYTVTLTVTNSYGNNTKTLTSYITINKPTAPTATDVQRCGPGSVTLSSSTTNPVKWYDSTGAVISTANPFTTPTINNTTTYWLSDSVPSTTYTVGMSYTGSNGANYNQNSERGEVFNVLKSGTLVSVYVFASGAGNRTIRLLNSGGTVLSTKTVNVPAGGSRVTLNFPLTVGTGYQLTATGPANLFRNNLLAVYPYNDAGGIVSITGNTAAASGYYYFFYDWYVKEADCISQQKAVTVTIKPAIVATATTTNISCNGGSNGLISLNVTSGTPTYSFNWSNGSTSNFANNLAVGSYTVTITDAAGCTTTKTSSITQPSALTATASGAGANCGQSNGSATVTATGGTTAYSYLWNNGATTASLSNIPAGTYTVTVTDNNTCTATATTTVTSSSSINITPASTAANCYGIANGSATVSATGGTPGYTYNWSNGATGATVNNLLAGTYTVTVADASGCSTTQSITVSQPSQLSVNSTTTNASCGQSNGSATVSVSGGTSGYTYHWNTGSTAQTLSNVTSGNYTITVTDAHNCTTTATTFVSNNGSFSVAPTITNISCFGNNTGSASLNITGGTSPYSYSWSNGSSNSSLLNVSAGTYTATITDAASCNSTVSITITQPTALSVSNAVTNVACSYSTNGSVAATVTGGSPGYTYIWSNGATTATTNNLTAGTYTLTVTDANNCTGTQTSTVTAPAALSASASGTNASCGQATGSASVSVNGGTAGYVYQWNNGANTTTINNLASGIYTITVTDNNNCTATASTTISGSGSLVATPAVTNALCHGIANGSVTLSTTNGTGPYNYSWSTGATGATASNLAAGSYTATVTDANNCNTTVSVTVNEPIALTILTNNQMPTCHGSSNAASSVVVTGGTSAYTYAWSTGASTQSITGLTAGSYSVTVTDAHGCTVNSNVTIPEPSVITASATATDVTCFGNQNGTASVTAQGGTPGYSYIWSNGNSGATANNLVAGSYTATITDSHGCTTTVTTAVNQPTEIQFSTSSTDATTGLNNGTATVGNITGGASPYTVLWSNGETALTATGLAGGSYTATITDSHGCTQTSTVIVNEVTGLNDLSNILNFSIYPNPAKSNLTVKATFEENAVITMRNVLGQTVTVVNATNGNNIVTLDVSHLSAGVYFVELKNGAKSGIKQVIITQ
ncbi:MAG: PKD domain-containing protein [Chitinophagales bacterium]